jgi:hypothetical protein
VYEYYVGTVHCEVLVYEYYVGTVHCEVLVYKYYVGLCTVRYSYINALDCLL